MTRRLLAICAWAALATVSCDESPTGPSTHSSSTSSTGCSLPATPRNLRVTSMVRTSVELTWDAVPGATSYTLLVGSTPGASDSLNANTTQTSFRFTARDGRSFARVQAHNACGAGPSTGSIEFFIPG